MIRPDDINLYPSHATRVGPQWSRRRIQERRQVIIGGPSSANPGGKAGKREHAQVRQQVDDHPATFSQKAGRFSVRTSRSRRVEWPTGFCAVRGGRQPENPSLMSVLRASCWRNGPPFPLTGFARSTALRVEPRSPVRRTVLSSNPVLAPAPLIQAAMAPSTAA